MSDNRTGLRARLSTLLRHRWTRRTGVALAVLTVALSGVVVGVLLGGRTTVDVGPFRAQLAATPALGGETEINIPPLGSLHLDSHDGPVHLQVQLGELDQGRTEALIDNPGGIAAASQSAVGDVRSGITRLALRSLGAAVAGALLLAVLVFRRNWARIAWSGGLALATSAGTLGVAALTVRADSIEEPRYEGLLVNAPAVVGDARKIADNYGRYADQLQALVGNVGRIYTAVSTLPVYEPAPNTTRVLHISDMHLSPTAWPVLQTVVKQFGINVVIDTGDIVDWGSAAEASYVDGIRQLGVPYVYVRGNHDSMATAAAVDRQPDTTVLDGTVATVNGLTIAGIGDPRFTPDKTNEPAPGGAAETDPASSPETRSGAALAATIRASAEPVDIALIHDPAAAQALDGVVPVVLAGHTHKREVRMLDPLPGATATRLMVQGSTGGAGLRGLEGEQPLPLAMSVLYFDENQVLKAYDDIQVGGTGQAQVTLERKVVEDPAREASPTTPLTTQPSAPNGSASGGPAPDGAQPGGSARSSAEPGSGAAPRPTG
ncbi:metallophosphoesterase family protein [Spirilliplanes yamanashiensis]|uniref:Membrane protein n=1 Tax=Spirilliplanes yamanashiensis TaxID=42233 RepID=A0A8J3Y443_9ACTN|nr:metallophosphoesterase [Spirilliplanes yamanashiensis]MDP9819809.1 putative MPP superfamily phosphohydrolase [Spirilliplanes yamanashiensis]GIJ01371.1 membrane protein [Spirilliplanes yamanashiensis]